MAVPEPITWAMMHPASLASTSWPSLAQDRSRIDGGLTTIIGLELKSRVRAAFRSSRTPSARKSKGFPTELEAKQFARAMLSEGFKVAAGTLNSHQPTRCRITASKINRWIEETEWCELKKPKSF
jgi:hypothetical protein